MREQQTSSYANTAIDNCKNEHPSGGGGGGGFQSNANRFAPLQNPSGGNARGRSGAVSGVGGEHISFTAGAMSGRRSWSSLILSSPST